MYSLHPSDSLGKFFLPVPTTLSFAGLEVLASYWGALLPGAIANLQLSWEIRIPPGHYGLLLTLKQQAITSFLPRKVGMDVINSLVTFGLPMWLRLHQLLTQTLILLVFSVNLENPSL